MPRWCEDVKLILVQTGRLEEGVCTADCGCGCSRHCCNEARDCLSQNESGGIASAFSSGLSREPRRLGGMSQRIKLPVSHGPESSIIQLLSDHPSHVASTMLLLSIPDLCSSL